MKGLFRIFMSLSSLLSEKVDLLLQGENTALIDGGCDTCYFIYKTISNFQIGK